jgi:hypothetical protein
MLSRLPFADTLLIEALENTNAVLTRKITSKCKYLPPFMLRHFEGEIT